MEGSVIEWGLEEMGRYSKKDLEKDWWDHDQLQNEPQAWTKYKAKWPTQKLNLQLVSFVSCFS